MKDLKNEIYAIENFVLTEFEKNLFRNSLQKLEFVDDPTRYNSFAGTFREFFRHLLFNMAPDDEVRNCDWFEVYDESKPKMITRAQRVQYIICKGLMEEFVQKKLKFDMKNAIKQTLKPVDTLNKYVHLDESTFNIKSDIGDEVVERCIVALHQFTIEVDKFYGRLRNIYEDMLYNYLLELMIEETFDDLDILSTHTRVEGVSINSVRIVDIDSNEIQIEIDGQVDVELQYGSDGENDDDSTLCDSYSFASIHKCIPVLSPLNVNIKYEDIIVDTSSFYDDYDDFEEYEYDEYTPDF